MYSKVIAMGKKKNKSNTKKYTVADVPKLLERRQELMDLWGKPGLLSTMKKDEYERHMDQIEAEYPEILDQLHRLLGDDKYGELASDYKKTRKRLIEEYIEEHGPYFKPIGLCCNDGRFENDFSMNDVDQPAGTCPGWNGRDNKCRCRTFWCVWKQYKGKIYPEAAAKNPCRDEKE